MKIAIIADSHFGCRKNSQYFMKQQKKYYEECFFPYLKSKGIKIIFHLGDFFDNRKTVNFETLRHAKDCFINPIIKNGMILHMLIGNHDSFYKSNGDITSTKLLFDDIDNIYIYDYIEELNIHGVNFLMVPWIFPIQQEKINNILRTTTSDVVCGHFEMNGVVFQGNTISRKGMDTDTFSHIPHVFSGHYHKKSQYYVGSPYEMCWSDFNDEKRIVIFDTETQDTEDVYIADPIHHKIIYPDVSDQSWMPDIKDKIIRVIVEKKENPADFDKYIEKLESFEPHSIDIKEEYLYVDVINDDDLDDETDTLGVLLASIDNMDELSDGDQTVIKEIMKQLYEKAGNNDKI